MNMKTIVDNKPKKIKVGIVQQSNTADIKDNLKKLGKNIEDCAKKGAELVVLQEIHNTLYFCQVEDTDNFDFAEPIPGPSTKHYAKLAKDTSAGAVLVMSIISAVIGLIIFVPKFIELF